MSITKKMNLIFICVALLALASCGREAADVNAPKERFAENQVLPYSTNLTVVSDIRSATIVVFPTEKDVAELEFYPMEGTTSEEWSALINEVTYSDRLLTSFTKEMEPFQKAMDLNQLIFSAGRYRDGALREVSNLTEEVSTKEEVVKKFEEESNMRDLKCYYASRPRRGNPYVCKFVKDETYRRTKTFSRCDDWARYTLESGQESHESFSKFTEIKEKCAELQSEVDLIADVIKTKKAARMSAENVVLDVLLETEKLTDLVFVAKVATVEKPDSSGPESTLKLSDDGMSVEEFKLNIDFLPGNASRVGYYEYSMENGAIQNVNVYFSEEGVKKMSFTLELPDMKIDVDGDVSVESMPIGLRVVDSQTYVRYNNGDTRRGVFKLEFNLE